MVLRRLLAENIFIDFVVPENRIFFLIFSKLISHFTINIRDLSQTDTDLPLCPSFPAPLRSNLAFQSSSQGCKIVDTTSVGVV